MFVVVPRETHPGERRVALVPEGAQKLRGWGWTVRYEAGAGVGASYPDEALRAAGAEVAPAGAGLFAGAEVVLRVRKPAGPEAFAGVPAGAWHLSFLDPFREKALVAALAAAGLKACSLELMPRTTLAQKMDALSSQASLAGYAAAVLGAHKLNRILPMMMTPAGTLQPARYLIVGAGVAGLQAIGVAKRLGARVEAFDTRPAAEEQVRSLGAKFVKIDLGGETGQTAQGYAKELTPEQLERQRAGLAKVCAAADVIITTAKVFGRPAPRILTAAMLDGMKPGSVVVDLAAESGGNVEGTRMDEEVVRPNGVLLLGPGAVENAVAQDASKMFSANLTAFLEHALDPATKRLRTDLDDPLVQAVVLTAGGAVVQEKFR